MSFVYFIHSPAMNAVKIGFSTAHPRRRMSTLQIGCADELELIGFYDAPQADEQKWHRRFGDYWIRGEWFRLDGEFADFIKAFVEHYWRRLNG